jgi:DNA-binding IclR family transcriptional regulator
MVSLSADDRQGPTERLTGADRVLAVLKELAHHPRGVTLDTLSATLGSPKSSVHRALAALRRAGLAEQDERGRYRLGLELVRLASEYYQGLDLRRLVEPLLDELAQRFGETAHFAVLDRSEIVYVAKVNPTQGGIQMTSSVGGRNPAHCTGLGKALLAHECPTLADVERYVAEFGPLQRRTEHTLTTAPELARELEEIRRRGYALDREESEVGIACIAFPVYLDSAERPAGAVSVATLVHRTPLETLEEAAPAIRALIAEALGAGAGAE